MAESYRRWRLPELWEMVSADDATDAHLHLATLRRQQTALEAQRDRLRVLRDQLAEAWPPSKSEAATAFVQRLNDMIDAFSATARGAAEVRGGLQLVSDAINDAREQLAPLVARYAKAQAAPDPRVGRQAQRLLDEEARRILMAADVTVHDASFKFAVALPDYARISTQAYIPPVNNGTTATGGAGADGGGGKNASARLSELPPPRFDPPPPRTEDINDDVELAGRQVDVGAGSQRPGDLQAVQAGDVPSVGYQPPIGGVGRVLGGGPVIGITENGAEGMARGVGAGTTRGIPGSVIGGAPMTSPAGSAHARPLPGQLGSARPTSATGRPASRAGGYQDRSFDEYVARRRGPGDEHAEQWTVQRGVTPLLEAQPPAHDHDPGPGVIGLDR
ncbi:hypothetical protein Daura_09075 [Dactylosporangium aurantiacum]|uniref:Uncharacterized protein n=1 Tax=Dactylosporangium aurantiacum TaxID=35754 RepID=A0A9Q9MP45_9ACTN|nr:hypothetical protein [Dactylosporangium aurantiacum]MDG6109757.1 hypothetical protein [Dactylosporangium aurantiacum]UWZ56307.1 hypothetical protein Daura_09075 [Dactylosporangium aurantiacum]